MKIAILTVGSRGDVQPVMVLGLGLQRAGHTVRMVASPNFESLVRDHGLDFAAMRDDARFLTDEKELQKRTQSGQNVVAEIILMQERMYEDSWAACQDVDVIVDSTSGWGYHIAEKLGLPYYQAQINPYTPTRAFPAMIGPALPLGGAYNMLTHRVLRQIAWQAVREPINRWRKQALGLAPIPFGGPYGRQDKQRMPIIYGYSSAVLPRPPDWPPWVHVAGFWLLDPPPGWQPPADLVDFLGSGPPPVYVGFGSMATKKAEELTEKVVQALTRTRQRGVLLRGWGGLSDSFANDDVFVVSDIPHAWLFPRMAAVVHHSAIGTISAGLRAGVPAVCVPFFADQPFWARRIAELSIGPSPIPQKQLSVERLAAAITTAVGDEAIRQRAAALGERIRAEDGIANAVEAFHAHLPSSVAA